MTPKVHRVSAGEIELSVREWRGEGREFLLVHGLASNACTWERVGRNLSARGHRAVAIDQRGHGRSDKPEGGYGFAEVTNDLHAAIASLGMKRPIVAGQSWGGNVVLEFAARYPEATSGIILVDGGFIDLSARPGATWESISQQLRPPNLIGTPRPEMKQRFHSFRPDWDDEQIEMQMGNYETVADGTIRPWLTLERHMLILKALWEQKPSQLSEKVTTPVLVATAEAPDQERSKRREEELAKVAASLRHAEFKHFDGAHHDIHVDQPDELTRWILEALERGFFA